MMIVQTVRAPRQKLSLGRYAIKSGQRRATCRFMTAATRASSCSAGAGSMACCGGRAALDGERVWALEDCRHVSRSLERLRRETSAAVWPAPPPDHRRRCIRVWMRAKPLLALPPVAAAVAAVALAAAGEGP